MSLFQKIGIDKSIAFSISGKVVQALGNLLVLYFISRFLTKSEQGFYYTFGSLAAIQIFFELGLNGIITQYVAHEKVHLQWVSQSELSGNEKHLSRLSSLLHFCLKVFGILAVILFLILTVSGYLFFHKYEQPSEVIRWQLPWALLALATSLMLLINPLLAFLEGLGKVKEIARTRFIQTIANITCITLVLVFDGGLFALGVASFVSFLTLLGGISFTDKIELLRFIYASKGHSKVDYWKEIFPFQWKIALSWISGYFIFQLFTPVLFATEGASVAGKMGMTLQALNGISSLSMSWITTKVPLMSSLIAEGNYEKLDDIFNKTLSQLLVVIMGLIVIFIVTVSGFNYYGIQLGQRFLPILPLTLLGLVTIINQYIFSWATYLRCHKQEPFLINSIVGGILCAISTIFLGKNFGLTGIVVGYLGNTCFGFIWGWYVFATKKREWHG